MRIWAVSRFIIKKQPENLGEFLALIVITSWVSSKFRAPEILLKDDATVAFLITEMKDNKKGDMILTCAEVVTLLKDVILSGAAITGSIVAIKGLGTWQRQLKGQSEYELSRRILVALFKYRDAINGVRHPAIWKNEQPSPSEDEANKMSSEQLRFYGLSKAYQTRWDKVNAERVSLYPDLLEAEALWGNELNDLFKGVFNLEHELFTRLRHYIELINPETDEPHKEAIRNIDKKRRDILYDDQSDEGDEFKRDLLAGIQAIEKYLKPKLKHEKHNQAG